VTERQYKVRSQKLWKPQGQRAQRLERKAPAGRTKLDFIKENTGRDRIAKGSSYVTSLVGSVSGDNGGQIEGNDCAADMWHKNDCAADMWHKNDCAAAMWHKNDCPADMWHKNDCAADMWHKNDCAADMWHKNDCAADM